MKKTKMTGIASLPSITDPEPVEISPEVLQQHQKLKMLYEKARHALYMRKGRPGKGLSDEEEVARANLRAYERKNGLTS